MTRKNSCIVKVTSRKMHPRERDIANIFMQLRTIPNGAIKHLDEYQKVMAMPNTWDSVKLGLLLANTSFAVSVPGSPSDMLEIDHDKAGEYVVRYLEKLPDEPNSYYSVQSEYSDCLVTSFERFTKRLNSNRPSLASEHA